MVPALTCMLDFLPDFERTARHVEEISNGEVLANPLFWGIVVGGTVLVQAIYRYARSTSSSSPRVNEQESPHQ